jgi:hypothetical protein
MPDAVTEPSPMAKAEEEGRRAEDSSLPESSDDSAMAG